MQLEQEAVPILFNNVWLAEVVFDVFYVPQVILLPHATPMLAGCWFVCNTMEMYKKSTVHIRLANWVNSAKIPAAYVLKGVPVKVLSAPPFEINGLSSIGLSYVTLVHRTAIPTLLRTKLATQFMAAN